MPALTLANGWSVTRDIVPTDQTTLQKQAQSLWLAVDAFLAAAGWVLEISSNGTTLKTDGTNTWAGLSDLVHATAGSAHSYQVRKSPVGMIGTASKQMRCLIDLGVGATNFHLANLAYGSAAFSSSGSVNTRPTDPSGAVDFNNKQVLHSTLANSKWTQYYSTSGSEIGSGVFWIAQDGSGRFCTAIGALGAHSYESADPWAAIGLAAFSESGLGALGTASAIASAANIAQFWTDGTSIATGGLMGAYYGGTDFMNQLATTSIGGITPVIPMYLISGTAAKFALRGYIVDHYVCPTGAGVTLPLDDAASSPATQQYGAFMAPCGGGVSGL